MYTEKYGQHLFHKEPEQQAAPDNVGEDMAKNASEDTMVKRRHSRPLVLESEEEEDEENSEKVEDPKSEKVDVSAQVLFTYLIYTCIKK